MYNRRDTLADSESFSVSLLSEVALTNHNCKSDQYPGETAQTPVVVEKINKSENVSPLRDLRGVGRRKVIDYKPLLPTL